jgi:hypothetical protein
MMIQTGADSGWIRRDREEGIVTLKDGFGEVEAAFASSVTTGVGGGWHDEGAWGLGCGEEETEMEDDASMMGSSRYVRQQRSVRR